MTQYNRARWISCGGVALTTRSIAEKWMEFYWPLISSDTFIPQIQGENPSSKKSAAFRGLMEN
jgi:hypothetical protein